MKPGPLRHKQILRLIVLCAMGLPAVPLHAGPDSAVPAHSADGNALLPVPGQQGRVAAVTTAADGTRRYSITAAPIRELSMRFGPVTQPAVDACVVTLVPR